MADVPLGKARFAVDQTAQGEVMTIPAVRHLLLTLFLSVWLAGWTLGGFTAISAIMRQFQPFVLVWLMGWALGWCAAAFMLAWMIKGKQTLRLVGGDLEVGLTLFGLGTRKLYHGTAINNLIVQPAASWPMRMGPQLPFGMSGGSGAVSFTYGARTRYLAAGLDQAEAAQIVAWLKTRLPTA